MVFCPKNLPNLNIISIFCLRFLTGLLTLSKMVLKTINITIYNYSVPNALIIIYLQQKSSSLFG